MTSEVYVDRRALLTISLAAMTAPAAPPVAPAPTEGTAAAFEAGYAARTHLANIIGFADLMLEENIPRERRDQYAGHVADSASALLACLESFMDELGTSAV
jgi:hypothetical protein